MDSNSTQLVTVSTPGKPDLKRTVASCYKVFAGAYGSDRADIWLMALAGYGIITNTMHGVTVTFTLEG